MFTYYNYNLSFLNIFLTKLGNIYKFLKIIKLRGDNTSRFLASLGGKMSLDEIYSEIAKDIKKLQETLKNDPLSKLVTVVDTEKGIFNYSKTFREEYIEKCSCEREALEVYINDLKN